jgi:hypothetical protein
VEQLAAPTLIVCLVLQVVVLHKVVLPALLVVLSQTATKLVQVVHAVNAIQHIGGIQTQVPPLHVLLVEATAFNALLQLFVQLALLVTS